MINTVAVLAGLHRRRTTGEGSMLSTSQFGTSVFAGSVEARRLHRDSRCRTPARSRLRPGQARSSFRHGGRSRRDLRARPVPCGAGSSKPSVSPPTRRRTQLERTSSPASRQGPPTTGWGDSGGVRVPAGSVRAAPSLVEALRCEPQVVAEQLVEEHDPRRGGVLYPAPPWEVVGASASPTRAAPELGEHDELVKGVIDPAPPHAEFAPCHHIPRLHHDPVEPDEAARRVQGHRSGHGAGGRDRRDGPRRTGRDRDEGTAPLGRLRGGGKCGSGVKFVENHLHSAKTVEQLDLASPDHRNRLDRLVQQASAVIVAGPMRFRHAFALDDGDVRAARRDIVYCGLTGYGSSGPLADVPATEFDVQLTGGMTRQVGRTGAPPVRQGFHLVSVNTGYAAAQAVMAGLLTAVPADPEDAGGGRHFEVSLLRTAVALNGWNLTAESGHDGVAGKQVQATDWPADHGYTCEDRQVLISIRNSDEGWMRFLTALDRVDLLADERFNSLEHLRANEWQLPGLLAETTALRTSDELELIVKECGGQFVPVLQPGEVLDHPQVAVQHLVRAQGGRFELPIDVVSRA